MQLHHSLIGLGALLLGGAVLATPPPGTDDQATGNAALIAAGKQLYHTGKSVTGMPLQAAVRSDVRMAAGDLACVRCHRRSGLGSSEGGVGIPPIAGSTLFTPQTTNLVRDYRGGELSNLARPAYTHESLAAALRSGINPAGRELSPLMPRYEVSSADVAAIAAYLATLSTTTSPGVTEHELHLSTIMTPDADTNSRRSMLAVLEAYVAQKNAGTRGETLRAKRAPFHREWMYSAYRKWVLHEWRLSGPANLWPQQLERYYREQPVFAVVGGIGRGEWQPIHEFCERRELPCLFPHLEAAPSDADRDFYSIYFSRGVLLEAEAAALHLRRIQGQGTPVLQVLRNTPGQLAAAAALRAGLNTPLETHLIATGQAVDAGYWRRLLERTRPRTMVLWLGADDLAGLTAAADSPDLPAAIYLSSTLVSKLPLLPGQLGERVTLLHPFQLPGEEGRQARFRIWAAQAGIGIQNSRVQSDAFFAITLAAEALTHIRGNLSREYFIERIEHMTDSMIYTSTYPRLGLAPGQRYAAKGVYVWRPEGGPETALWVVP